MNFAYPSQRLQDWLSQQWCIWRGRRIDPEDTGWLMGPFGNVDTVADTFIDVLAEREGLHVQRRAQMGGLLSSIDQLGLTAFERHRLSPAIVHFYENTSRYELSIHFQWTHLFRSCGWVMNALYGNRLRQLNFPLDRGEFDQGTTSEIARLVNLDTDEVKHTIWYRTLRESGRVLYAGMYTTCRMPSGRVCVKVIFPLPRGNATVIMTPRVRADGSLQLISAGERYGDPGFYFILEDADGHIWAQYIRSFRECLNVVVDGSGRLRAHHSLSLLRQRVLDIRYGMIRRL